MGVWGMCNYFNKLHKWGYECVNFLRVFLDYIIKEMIH